MVGIYFLLRWGKEARALRVSLGILSLRIIATIARQLDLSVTAWILDLTKVIALVLLLILFHTELRSAVLRLDIVEWFLPRGGPGKPGQLRAISDAAFSLAPARRGALIVITRRDSLSELVTRGVPLGGEISPEILEAIFRKVSVVHDGVDSVNPDIISVRLVQR